MFSLLVDTCTEHAFAAIAKDSIILNKIVLPIGYDNSKMLLPALEDLIKQSKISLNDLVFIAVANGPGSYTGIRAGASAAKTLSYALKIPLIGVCSLENFIPLQEGLFISMIDAKIGGAYAMEGNKQQDTITFSTEPALYPLESLTGLLCDDITIVTPKAEQLRKKMDACYPQFTIEWEERPPAPEQMLKNALNKFQKGQFSKDGSLDILYLRKTQAEIERERK